MNKVLRKRLLRELRSNFTKYLALLLLIVMGMYLVISIVGSAETIITRSKEKAEENKVEDGQFSVFIPLTQEQKELIEKKGYTIEEMFSLDMEVSDGSVLRAMKVREHINLIALDSGVLPEAEGECVLEKRYAEEHGLQIGDTIAVSGIEVQIVGIGSTPDYDAPYHKFSDTAVSSVNFGTIFLTEDCYEYIRDNVSLNAETYCYSYRLGDNNTSEELKAMFQDFSFHYADIEDEYFMEMIEEKLETGYEMQDGMEVNNLISFIEKEDNIRIGAAAGDVILNKNVGLIAGIIVMVLFMYVISVFVVHQIQQEASVIGALYALGAKKKDLMFHYVTLPALTALVGGAIGTVIGFSPVGMTNQMAQSYSYFSLPSFENRYPVYLLIYGIVMPPVIAMLVNTVIINKKLSRTALSLMRNEQSVAKTKVQIKKGGFVKRFQMRQILREFRCSLTVVFGMLISLLVLMLALNCYVLCNNVSEDMSRDTKYGYMYTFKYPMKEAPEGGEACYIETLSKERFGYTLDVSVVGIDENNPYFPDVHVKTGKNKVMISSAVAAKYDLSDGDTLVLSDDANEMVYAFTVEEVVTYEAGLMVFMDIDSMRELFGQEEDYYNCVLSDHKLDVEEGRLYSTTTKDDVEKSAGIFVEAMGPMVFTLIAAGVIIYFAIMYLMQGVMIDRASFGIALIKTFGYRTKEVKKLYLNGNFYTVFFGAVIGIPLSKFILDKIFPYFVSNVSCGVNLTFPWQLYLLIILSITGIYFIINTLLVRKLNKITSAEVLKTRE